MKKLLIALIIILILYFAVNYTLNTFLPEKIDKAAKSFVAEHSDKRIKISRIEINVIKGVDLLGVTFFEKNNKTPYLKINKIRLIPFYPSLLSDKKVFFSVKLEGLNFTLKRNSDNTFNLPQIIFEEKNSEALGQEEKQIPPKVNKDTAPAKNKEFFVIKSASIKKLDLSFEDETVNFKKTFKNITISADFVNLSKIHLKIGWQKNLNLNASYDINTKELKTSTLLRTIPLSEFTPYFKGIIVKDGYLKEVNIVISGKQNYIITSDAVIENVFAEKNDLQFKGNINLLAQIALSGGNPEFKISGNITKGFLKSNSPYLDSLNSIKTDFTLDKEKLSFPNIETEFYKVTDNESQVKTKILLTGKTEIDFNKSQMYIEANTNQEISQLLDALKNLKTERLEAINKFTYKEKGTINLKAAIKTNFVDNSFEYYIDYKIKNARFNDFKNIFARGFVKKDKLSVVDCSLNYKNDPLKLKAEINNFSKPLLSLQAENKFASLLLNISSANGKTTIEDLDIKTKKSHLASKGTLETKDKKLLKLTGAASLDCVEVLSILNKYNIKLPLLEKLKPKGILSAKFFITGDLEPGSWQVKTAALSEKMELYGVEMSNMKIEFYRDKDLVIISPMLFEAASGKCDLRLKVNTENKKIVVNLLIDDVDLAILRKQLNLKSKNLSGILSLSADFENKNLFKLDSLDGSGKISIKEGNIWEINFLKGMGEFLFIPEFEEIKFDQGTSDLIFKGENVVFENIELRSFQMALRGQGRISLKGDLNFMLVSEFNPKLIASSGGLQKIFTSVLGQTALTIDLEGTVQNPTYKVQPVMLSDLKGFQKILKGIFGDSKK